MLLRPTFPSQRRSGCFRVFLIWCALSFTKTDGMHLMRWIVNQGIEWEYFSMTPNGGAVFLPVSDELYELILDVRLSAFLRCRLLICVSVV